MVRFFSLLTLLQKGKERHIPDELEQTTQFYRLAEGTGLSYPEIRPWEEVCLSTIQYQHTAYQVFRKVTL